MSKHKFLLFLSLLTINIQAQQSSKIDSIELKNYALQQLTSEKYNDPGEKHLNIYYKDSWLPGIIFLSGGQTISGKSLKYNGANNQLILLDDKFGPLKVDNQAVQAFILKENKQSYKFIKVKLDTLNFSEGLFCEFVYSSKIDIYVYRRVKSVSTHNTINGMQRIYRPKPVYILFINNKIILLNKATQSAVYEQFPDLKDKIKERNHQNYKKINTEKDFFTFLKEIEDILVEIVY